jgi:predicted lipid-binding transport protein (Tim44 family)
VRRVIGRSTARRVLKRLAVAALLWAATGFPVTAFARGGGGGHGGGGGGHSGGGGGHSGGFGGYHGGGYHGGYYGNGGGGGSVLFVLFIAFVLVPIVLFFVWRSMRTARGAMMDTSEAMQRFRDEQSVDLVHADAVADGTLDAASAITAMRTSDPEFEPETFMQRAEMTFFLVKRAYQHRDVNEAKPYLTPALATSWDAGVQQLLAEHHKPLLESLNVRGMHVAGAHHDATQDAVDVHFDIVFRGKLFDDRDGKLLADAGDDKQTGERWTFVRGAGVKTVDSGGVVAQKCPKCGAPLELTADARCRFCNAAVSTGEFDWTVSAMAPAHFDGLALDPLLDQVEMPAAQGIAEIKAADPAFDETAFVARAKEAFLALQDAWQARNVDPARGFMSPGLYFSWSAQVEQLTDEHRKNMLEGMRVDNIVPVRVLHGHVFDDVTVRVDATTADYEVDDQTGKMLFGSRTPQSFTEFWTFQRAIGAQTGTRSLFDKVCPNCGAPLDVNAIGECKYCKAAVTSGKFDWVLSRIEQDEAYSGARSATA